MIFNYRLHILKKTGRFGRIEVQEEKLTVEELTNTTIESYHPTTITRSTITTNIRKQIEQKVRLRRITCSKD